MAVTAWKILITNPTRRVITSMGAEMMSINVKARVSRFITTSGFIIFLLLWHGIPRAQAHLA